MIICDVEIENNMYDVESKLLCRNGEFSAETDKLKKSKGRNEHFTFKENKTQR